MAENLPSETPPEPPQMSFFDKALNFIRNSRNFAETAWDKVQHISRSNVEMGIIQMRSGEFFDAILRFKIAIFFDKTNPIAYYLLGKSLIYSGKKAKASAPLRKALALNPGLTEANFLLAMCGGGNELTEIPRSFIIERADIIAANYSKIYPEDGKTNLTNKLQSEFAKYFETWQGFVVLDLNCAGGEVGALMREKANTIIGVDPSIKMGAIAKQKRVGENLSLIHI
jgi:tetratricopeptide (TPR) repeat protein